uniref:Uncharacterized protein n=1 Tax=Oryzias latipes TaxID=8090 RepID=A0A3P9JHF7_ORYLA
DWVHKNLYWTDSIRSTISVATADGSHRKTLFHQDLSKPRAIVVDPHSNFLYWTDWGNPAKIEKGGLNGGGRSALVTDSIVWPNGITLDLLNQRLYWVDSKLHTLSSVDVQGGGRRTLIIDEHKLAHPLGLPVFKVDVHCWKPKSITNKVKISLQNTIPKVSTRNTVFILNSPAAGRDWCNTSRSYCDFMCLAAPQVGSHPPKYTCVFPDHQMLASDMRSCAPTPAGPSQSESPSASTTRLPLRTSPRATLNPRLHHYFHYYSQADRSESPADLHRAVLSLLAVGGVLLWRNFRLRSSNTIHFHNPVYQKTTEDQVHIWRSNSLDGYSYPKVNVTKTFLNFEDD